MIDLTDRKNYRIVKTHGKYRVDCKNTRSIANLFRKLFNCKVKVFWSTLDKSYCYAGNDGFFDTQQKAEDEIRREIGFYRKLQEEDVVVG